MHVAIVHTALSEESSPDDLDVLAQVNAVEGGLKALGHTISILTCDLNLSEMSRRLKECNADLIFNLVESISGHGRLIYLFPALLDALSIPYTGSNTESLWMTSHKVLSKDRMAAAGLPTPPWIGPFPDTYPRLPQRGSSGYDPEAHTWIVKSLWEHA
ncbi:MAG: D-alanine--D-alanine ligase, partial [Thermodesulfobacteriota bacterium]